jgi:hypothetical protein
MEDEAARAEVCFAIATRLKAGLQSGREALWDVAKAAAEFDDQSGWTALGYDSMRHWLAEPDIGMSRRTFLRLVSTWREMEKRQVSSARLALLEPAKVDVVLPKVRSGAVELDDALADAEELGYADLRHRYQGAKEDPEPREDEDLDPGPTVPQRGTTEEDEDASLPPLEVEVLDAEPTQNPDHHHSGSLSPEQEGVIEEMHACLVKIARTVADTGYVSATQLTEILGTIEVAETTFPL